MLYILYLENYSVVKYSNFSLPLCMYMCMCMLVGVYICMYVCMYVCVYVYIYIHAHTQREWMCMHVCMYVYMYVYIYPLWRRVKILPLPGFEPQIFILSVPRLVVIEITTVLLVQTNDKKFNKHSISLKDFIKINSDYWSLGLLDYITLLSDVRLSNFPSNYVH